MHKKFKNQNASIAKHKITQSYITLTNFNYFQVL
jgi:hypothetical protein